MSRKKTALSVTASDGAALKCIRRKDEEEDMAMSANQECDLERFCLVAITGTIGWKRCRLVMAAPLSLLVGLELPESLACRLTNHTSPSYFSPLTLTTVGLGEVAFRSIRSSETAWPIPRLRIIIFHAYSKKNQKLF